MKSDNPTATEPIDVREIINQMCKQIPIRVMSAQPLETLEPNDIVEWLEENLPQSSPYEMRALGKISRALYVQEYMTQFYKSGLTYEEYVKTHQTIYPD